MQELASVGQKPSRKAEKIDERADSDELVDERESRLERAEALAVCRSTGLGGIVMVLIATLMGLFSAFRLTE